MGNFFFLPVFLVMNYSHFFMFSGIWRWHLVLWLQSMEIVLVLTEGFKVMRSGYETQGSLLPFRAFSTKPLIFTWRKCFLWPSFSGVLLAVITNKSWNFWYVIKFLDTKLSGRLYTVWWFRDPGTFHLVTLPCPRTEVFQLWSWTNSITWEAC